MRTGLMVITTLLILAGVNHTIYRKEAIIANGAPLLLELAPVDPRSLMQGDYMALAFAVEREAFPPDQWKKLRPGQLVVTVDERRIGKLSRLAGTSSAGTGELCLQYRLRKGRPVLVTNAYFFQEGRGLDYTGARFGEFRVGKDGEAILIGLRDADMKVMGRK